MFDHVGLNVKDYEASRAFYERALAPLGYGDRARASPSGRRPGSAATRSRRSGSPSASRTARARTSPSLCPDRATVDAFHDAALDAGGIDNGAPGLREQYHPTYYGAFVHDLDGNNVEAVCHRPE